MVEILFSSVSMLKLLIPGDQEEAHLFCLPSWAFLLCPRSRSKMRVKAFFFSLSIVTVRNIGFGE